MLSSTTAWICRLHERASPSQIRASIARHCGQEPPSAAQEVRVAAEAWQDRQRTRPAKRFELKRQKATTLLSTIPEGRVRRTGRLDAPDASLKLLSTVVHQPMPFDAAI